MVGCLLISAIPHLYLVQNTMSIFPSLSIPTCELPYIYQPGYFFKIYVLCIEIKMRKHLVLTYFKLMLSV